LDNWTKIEFIFAHKLHTSPIDLEKLEFYRIQYILKEYEEYVDKENKEYQKQQREIDKQQKTMKVGSGQGNLSVPKFETPKFDMPKY
jgi:hypothetical protein